MATWRGEQVAEWTVNPSRGAELGVCIGRFSEYMLKRVPGLHMVAVDLWQHRPETGRPGGETYASWDMAAKKAEYLKKMAAFDGRVTTLEMDTVEAADHVPDASLDFVFIDADHTYEGVRRDIAAWRQKIRPGGVLCGHDHYKSFPGVARAVAEVGLPVTLGAETCWMIRLP